MLWAAVLADVGTCLLVMLHNMMLLREPGTGKQRGGAPKACRARARSLTMRSQLAGASNSAPESAQEPGGGPKAGCHCCQKPSEPFEQEHTAVVISIPAPSAEHPDVVVDVAAPTATEC